MRFLFRLFALAVLAAAIGGAWIVYRLNQPYKGFSDPVFVEFARGTSTRSIATVLADKGVIEDRWLFLAARGLRRGTNLQAGEYKFDKPASPFEILGRLARGDIYYMELLVPEGFNMFDIAEAVGKLGTMRPETFLAAAKNPAMIRDLDPDAPFTRRLSFPQQVPRLPAYHRAADLPHDDGRIPRAVEGAAKRTPTFTIRSRSRRWWNEKRAGPRSARSSRRYFTIACGSG